MKNSIIYNKSFDFSIKIVRLYKELNNENESVLARQVLRSGTSIGANVSEALNGQSKRDFVAKLYISLKETNETLYWLRLLEATDYLSKDRFEELNALCEELRKIISSIILTTKQRTDTKT